MEDQRAAGVPESERQDSPGAICLPAREAPYNSALFLILAATLPILVSGGIFFVDGPNHLFRVTLWETMRTGELDHQFFQVGGDLYPNLTIDLVTGVLSRIIPPPVALTLFICLSIGLYIFAVIWWRQQRGEGTDLPLLLIILLAAYSEPLYWGLFNYILGLAVMFVALHRAIEQGKSPSDSFAISQALIVGAMCLTSIFPVMLYVCFCLGMLVVAAYDDWRAGRLADSAHLIKSHWLSAVVVAVLVTVMEPGQTGKTEWHLATKVTGVFTLGKTTNLSLEYLLSLLVLGTIAWLTRRRGLSIGRYELAGLLACCLLYVVMPKDLMSVGAADRRLAPAIVTILVVFVRGPSLGAARPEGGATVLLAGILTVKFGLLLYFWAPLRELDAAYAQIVKKMPANAIVLFVPPVEEERINAVERARRFMRLALALRPVPASEAHVFVQHPHLLLRNLAGQNVLPTQVFSNFWAKRAPEFDNLPDPATSQTLADVAAALAWLPPNMVSHVISHVDLDATLAPDISLQKIAEDGPVKLYAASRVGPDLLHWPDG